MDLAHEVAQRAAELDHVDAVVGVAVEVEKGVLRGVAQVFLRPHEAEPLLAHIVEEASPHRHGHDIAGRVERVGAGEQAEGCFEVGPLLAHLVELGECSVVSELLEELADEDGNDDDGGDEGEETHDEATVRLVLEGNHGLGEVVAGQQLQRRLHRGGKVPEARDGLVPLDVVAEGGETSKGHDEAQRHKEDKDRDHLSEGDHEEAQVGADGRDLG
mmetsp:Transcript_33635/g.72566  ORF Transcript_33635/g.72566 Transcript_33635/m.72566 type:complete len:216 (-) Transcript_33635:107-754(-)